MANPLSADQLRKMHAYWRAANYLSVGQIYLFDNPLLKEPLQLKHIKPRLLGHWGTTPGQCMWPQPATRPATTCKALRNTVRRKRFARRFLDGFDQLGHFLGGIVSR